MAEDVPAAAIELLEDHDAFAAEEAEERYQVTTTPFDATIAVEPPEDPGSGDAAGSDEEFGLEDQFEDEAVDAEPGEEADPSDDAGELGDAAEVEDAASAADAGDGTEYVATFDVTIVLPTLDSVVADEIVSDEVEDAWHSTLSLRLEDAYGVAEVDPLEDETFDIRGTEIHTHYRFAAPDARHGVNDAKVIVDFVEGTYLQGVIPGYEYEDPVASMLQRATDAAQGSSDGAERGGTPL